MLSADVQHMEDARTARGRRSHSTWKTLVQHVEDALTEPAVYRQTFETPSYVATYSRHCAVHKGHDIHAFLSRTREYLYHKPVLGTHSILFL